MIGQLLADPWHETEDRADCKRNIPQMDLEAMNWDGNEATAEQQAVNIRRWQEFDMERAEDFEK